MNFNVLSPKELQGKTPEELEAYIDVLACNFAAEMSKKLPRCQCGGELNLSFNHREEDSFTINCTGECRMSFDISYVRYDPPTNQYETINQHETIENYLERVNNILNELMTF